MTDLTQRTNVTIRLPTHSYEESSGSEKKTQQGNHCNRPASGHRPGARGI